MMKMKLWILMIVLLQPLTVKAETIIGVSALGYLLSIPNVYYQQSLSDKTAYTIEIAASNVSHFDGFSIAGSYKKYWNDNKLGGYYRFGLASLTMSGTSTTPTSAVPIIIVGSEKKINDNMHFSLEAGPGSSVGFGIFTVNVSYQY